MLDDNRVEGCVRHIDWKELFNLMATVMTCYIPRVMNQAGVFSVMLHCNGQYSATVLKHPSLMYYYIKIKLGTISPARCSPPVGRQDLKLGMWVVYQKCHIEPRGFGDSGPPSRARRRKHAFRVQLTMVNPVKPVDLGHDRIKPTATS